MELGEISFRTDRGGLAGMLKLVGSAKYRPFRNVWMLEELGVPWTHDPAKPRSKSAAEVNPFAKVPTLLDEDIGVTMYESIAINTHLGDRFRGHESCPTLVPPPATAERARYEQLTHCIGGKSAPETPPLCADA